MSRHLSVASVIDKNKIASQTAWLPLLKIKVVDPNTRQVRETLCIVGNNEAVIFGVDDNGQPQTYLPGNFTFNVDQQHNEEPRVTIQANDQSGYIQQRMDDAAGGVFSEVTLTVVNSARLDKDPEIQEVFQINRASVKNYVVSFELGTENPLSIRFPKARQFKDRCAWRFRGYGCRYAGPMMTCDYTKSGPNGCVAHNNVKNFRGLPGLVKMNL